MPCVSGPPTSEEVDESNRRAAEHEAQLVKQKQELDKVTRLLCDLMRTREQTATEIGGVTPEHLAWWNEHKVIDAKRIAKEKKQEEARRQKKEADKLKRKKLRELEARLTPEEIDLIRKM